MQLHAHSAAHAWNIGDVQKKADLVWLRKVLSVKHKDLRRKSCVFICYFVDSLMKIVLSEAATGGVLYKKVFLKFAKSTGKYLCQSLFLNKFASTTVNFLCLKKILRVQVLKQCCRPAILLRDFNTGVFLWIFQNFWNNFLYITTTVAAFELCFSIKQNFSQRRLAERFN